MSQFFSWMHDFSLMAKTFQNEVTKSVGQVYLWTVTLDLRTSILRYARNVYFLAFLKYIHVYTNMQFCKPRTDCVNNSTSEWIDDVCIKRGSKIGWGGGVRMTFIFWNSYLGQW